MHELSLCGAIADIATRQAADRVVEIVHIRVGQLRQIVPDTLVFCWSIVTAETALAGSVLHVERVPALLRCGACEGEHELGNGVSLACRTCGSLDITVLTGEEFLVTALELAEV